MNYETVIYEEKDGIAKITLNRPEALNATQKMYYELNSILDNIDNNANIRVIILTGSGRAFCSGMDISAFLGGEFTGKAGRLYERALFKRFETNSRPVIVAINGFAIGGGLELALCRDFRIVSETAQIGNTEINLGIIPSGGGTQRLPRLIGVPKAKELILLGDRVSAKEAEKIGLVNKITSPEELDNNVFELAKRLRDKAPLAVSAAKYAINKVFELGTDLDTGLMIESDLGEMVEASEDAEEGMKAFMAKRKPEFKSK